MSYEIPEMQWAQVLLEDGKTIEYKQIPVPKPGPSEILVKIVYTGVCHTDLHAAQGDWPVERKLPLVGGHEGAGIVVARGSLATEFEIGDRAGIKWMNGTCLSCEFCKTANESLCPEMTLSGYTVDGTFQQYAIASAPHATKIPKDVPLDAVAPILCAGVTVYKGIKEAKLLPGETLAIVGAGGGLGSLAIQYCKAMGIRPVAIDGGAEKQAMCEALGAEVSLLLPLNLNYLGVIKAYIDFMSSKNLVADVLAATPEGRGAHGVLLLAVSEKPFQQASEYVRSNGSVVCIGLPAHAYIKADVFNTVIRMIKIKGSYVGGRRDAEEAIDFFARGMIKAPYKIAPLKDLPKIFDLMKQGKIAGRYVLEVPQ
ncbi:alcohol dehydrogenase [Ascosphaera acerosa]|nr:alcohol dehydrogenase [Ascosphaera acerosa]